MAESTEPGVPVSPDLPRDDVYRPLALPAVIGFSLAALYAAGISIYGVSAFLSGYPMDFSALFLAPPILAAGFSFVGWITVTRSEGTRDGAGLARWGMILSCVCGVGYIAYYLATYLAIRDQATTYAEKWLDLLKAGDVDRAYRATFLPERQPPDDGKLHETLEGQFNTREQPGPNSPPTPSRRGRYSQFCMNELVQMLGQAGKDAKVELLGIKEWKYDQGAYEVQTLYRITTPERSSDILLTLLGTESKRQAYQGREWNVALESSKGVGSGFVPGGTRSNALDGQIAGLRKAAYQNFAAPWAAKLSGGNTLGAYLDTFPPDKRLAVAASLAGWAVGTGFLASEAPLPQRGFAFTGFTGVPQFFHEDVKKSVPRFYCVDPMRRKAALEQVELAFSDQSRRKSFTLEEKSERTWTRTGNTLRIPFNLQINLQGNSPGPAEEWVEGTLFVEGEVPDLATHPSKVEWRVAGIELQRHVSQSAVAPSGRPGRPGG